MLAHLDELGPAFEIGLQPAERYFRHSELELQAIEEDPVVDGVEGCRQVEATVKTPGPPGPPAVQSPPHSFTPGLKPSFCENPSHRSLPFLLQD